MEVRKSEKMQSFIKGYSRLKVVGVNKLKDIFTPINIPKIVNEHDRFFYLPKFANLKTIEYKIYNSPNKVYLYEKFEVVNRNRQVSSIIEDEYKIGAISQIVRIGILNIYYSLKTTLFILSKYGIFEIATYSYKIPETYEDYVNIVKEAYRNVKITLLPSQCSEFATNFKSHFEKIIKDNIQNKNYDLEFDYEKFENFDIPTSSSLYVDDKFVCDIDNVENCNKTGIKYNLKVNGKDTGMFASIVSEYDFENITPDILCSIIRCYLIYCENFYICNKDIDIYNIKHDSINDIYTEVIKYESEGIIKNRMKNAIFRDLKNSQFKLLREFEDKESFLGKSYLFGKDIEALSTDYCNLFVYKTVDYNLEKNIKSAIIFAESKDNTGDIEVFTIGMSLNQCFIDKFKNMNFNCYIPLPYYFLKISWILDGNITPEYDEFKLLNKKDEEKLFSHIFENIKDKKLEVKIVSDYLDIKVDKCLKALFDNSNKINVNMVQPRYTFFHSISKALFYVNGKLINTTNIDLIQKENVAQVSDNPIAINRYRNEEIEKTFEELGVEPYNISGCKLC